MDDDKKQKFNERMVALKEKYCLQLPEKYHEIENSWKAYQSDITNPDLYETFYRLIHTLKGTAGTFGFNKQADFCFEIQKILMAKNDDSVLTETSIMKIQQHLTELKMKINTPAENISE